MTDWYLVRTVVIELDEYYVEATSADDARAQVLDREHNHRLQVRHGVGEPSEPYILTVERAQLVEPLPSEGGEG